VVAPQVETPQPLVLAQISNPLALKLVESKLQIALHELRLRAELGGDLVHLSEEMGHRFGSEVQHRGTEEAVRIVDAHLLQPNLFHLMRRARDYRPPSHRRRFAMLPASDLTEILTNLSALNLQPNTAAQILAAVLAPR